ncbi:MAG: 3-phosphoshikimate 1-carboxyvinyltransferase [Bacteroidota bacterium]
MRYHLSKANTTLRGTIHLNGSKSIANRLLIIQALCQEDFTIHDLSNSKDTVTLQALLQQMRDDDGTSEITLDTGAAGTTFRFMTAYLALQEGTQILTGSERMKQRPIGVLAEALNELGAKISYIEKEGYPPLRIETPNPMTTPQLSIAANTSSQYITALLLIAPTLAHGLTLTLVGDIVSRPYIEMTLSLMAYFGVRYTWEGSSITIASQAYKARDVKVEADWSAASYYYSMAALADEVDLTLGGLYEDSAQGDSVLTEMMTAFGVQTTFEENGVQLSKSATSLPERFEYDFLRCPDLAQTIAVVCGALGVPATFSGLRTLRIKETDRIAALQTELAKVGVQVEAQGDERMHISGKAQVNAPTFDTYEDHRMAMAFTPLAFLGSIQINEPMVVEKSYPDFYRDLGELGFEIQTM